MATPDGQLAQIVTDAGLEALREECRRGFPSEGAFEVTAVAWAVRARA